MQNDVGTQRRVQEPKCVIGEGIPEQMAPDE